MTNPKIRDFCRKIYSQHQKAIDLIIEYMPSDREKIQACLEEKIKSTKGIVLEHSTQSYISFSPESWTQIDLFNHAEGWMHSKHGLIFNIRNDVDSIVISLRIGPLPKEDRDYLYNLIQESDLFRDRNKHSEQFTSIARFKIMGDSEATGRTLEAIYKVIDTQWNIFLQDFLPPIEAFIIENLG